MWKNWLQRLSGKKMTTVDDAPMSEPATLSPAPDWQQLVCSKDGYSREAGLRAIMSDHSSERLVAIIERLNDWVPEVRETARSAFDNYLMPQHASTLIAHLPAILALEKCGRADHHATIKKLELLLAMPECVPQSAVAFRVSRGSCARLLFKVLAQSKPESDLETFVLSSLRHPDFSVRRSAFDKAMEFPKMAEQAITLGLSSNSSILRTQAFLQAIRLKKDCTHLIKDFLTAPTSATRSTALWAAQQHGIDPLQVLRVQLTGEIPTTRARWLGVLGLVQILGQRIPQEWLESALAHNTRAVRSLVLKIEGTDRPALLICAVADRSRNVFLAGVQGLRPQPWHLIAMAFTQQLEALWSRLPPSRRQALLELMPKWTQAGFLLQQLQRSPDDPASLEQIRTWADAQPFSISDRDTSKDERDRIIEQLTRLETKHALPARCITRLI